MQANGELVEIVRKRVETRLEEFLANAHADALMRAPEALPVVEQIRALTMRGGKRLRAALLVAAAETVVDWESIAPALIDVCASIELLQTYLLIHDDWMDDDAVRRGGPTVHIALGEQLKNAHLGAGAAVLAGDLACAMAQELALSEHLSSDRVRDVARALATMQHEVVIGQTLDLLGSSDLETMHDLKTGSYTVRGPLALGHACAGGSNEAWEALVTFARPMGIAFQLRDDWMGIFGDEKSTGKSAANDLRTGKRTAPVSLALERVDPVQRKELEDVLSAGTESAAMRARQIIEDAGVISVLEQKIASLRTAALNALNTPHLRSSGQKLLRELAHDMTERRK